MLVVTDEKTPWVSTEGRFSGSRQAGEECHIALVNVEVSK